MTTTREWNGPWITCSLAGWKWNANSFTYLSQWFNFIAHSWEQGLLKHIFLVYNYGNGILGRFSVCIFSNEFIWIFTHFSLGQVSVFRIWLWTLLTQPNRCSMMNLITPLNRVCRLKNIVILYNLNANPVKISGIVQLVLSLWKLKSLTLSNVFKLIFALHRFLLFRFIAHF